MLRYFEEKALLRPKKDETDGYQDYTNDDIALANKLKLSIENQTDKK